MARWWVPIGLVFWLGTTLLLAEVPWFSRAPLVERLRPYAPGGMGRPSRRGLLSVESLRDVVAPASAAVGRRLSVALGVSEELEVRLRRIHATTDVAAVRMRQLGAAATAFALGAALSLALAVPGAAAVGFLLGLPVLAFLWEEHRINQMGERWQRRVALELPTVAEQLALLLGAGWSLNSALARLAVRADGAVARDLRRVCARIEHGVGEVHALREWAEIARVPAVDRIVAVLALNRETAQLGRLITEEARAMRRDLHRELIELAGRRAQQVWIPVTVATLVPGVLFMAIPFVDALRMFGA